jgi:protein involved in polysaccharide export with SLBB domain
MQRSSTRGRQSLHSTILASFFGLLLFFVPLACLAEDYTLDTGDVLRVGIFGEPAYPLDVIVDDRGRISLPLLGEIEARGLTPGALSRDVRKAFQQQKLLVDPFVQVDIREYRPFFISGAVAQPGSYAFKPGITVRHALAMAGGFKALTIGDTAPALRIADLRAERANLLINQFRQRARLERLQAESQGKSVFAAPSAQSGEISPKLMSDIVAMEQEQLRARRLAFESDVSHLELSLARARKAAALVENERHERESAANFQLQQLETSRSLREKGLVTNTNLLNAERTQNSYRVDLAEADVEQARIEQEILNFENELRGKHSNRNLDLLSQIEQTQLDIAEIQSNLRYVNEKLLFIAQYGEHKTFDDLRGSVRIVVYRGQAAAAKAIEATEMTELKAGDVIEVSILPSRQFYDLNQ